MRLARKLRGLRAQPMNARSFWLTSAAFSMCTMWPAPSSTVTGTLAGSPWRGSPAGSGPACPRSPGPARSARPGGRSAPAPACRRRRLSPAMRLSAASTPSRRLYFSTSSIMSRETIAGIGDQHLEHRLQLLAPLGLHEAVDVGHVDLGPERGRADQRRRGDPLGVVERESRARRRRRANARPGAPWRSPWRPGSRSPPPPARRHRRARCPDPWSSRRAPAGRAHR